MKNSKQAGSVRQITSRITAILAIASLASVLFGCGGGAGSATPADTQPTSNVTKTAVQVNVGDSPADWMLAFSMNITSMSLTSSNGSATVVSASTPVEMMHLIGIMQPLAMISAPQGVYTGASITIGSATVMYLDPNTKAPVQATIPGPMTASVSFPSRVTVGSVPMAMGFDLDLATSVSMGTNGALSMTPVFHMSSEAQGSGLPSDFADGGIRQMMGIVSSVSATSFTMTSMQAAQSFTFSTNSATVFTGVGVGAMTNGALVLVDGTLQSDGSLLATHVQSMTAATGAMGAGMALAVSGSPIASVTMAMQNGAGNGMMAAYFSSGITVNLNASTAYQIDSDGIDMSGLPFAPVFDANHLYAGQSIMPIGTSAMTSGGMGSGMMAGMNTAAALTASQLMLVPQGISGATGSAISSGATSSFVVTLPSNCAFTTVTGAQKITVFQQQGTVTSGNMPTAAGAAVRVYGLLFFDGGQWKMVAARIAAT